jgi:hypothetical protein
LNAVTRHRFEDWLYHPETSLLSSMPKQPVDDVATRRLQQSFPVVSFRTRWQEAETHTQGNENMHCEAKDCMYEVVFHFFILLKIISKVRFFFNTKFFFKKFRTQGIPKLIILCAA